jgi:NADH-quinone oxidoreductase subunit E
MAEPVFQGQLLDAARAKIAEYERPRSAVLPLLHMLQDTAGHVTRDGMREIAQLVGISAAEVLGTASFYTMFKFEPGGRHLVSVCTSLSCQILGADELLANLLAHYGIAGKETTPDGVFTIEAVECAAACGGAPCLQIDYRFFEFVDPADGVAILEDVRRRGLDDVHAEKGSVMAPPPPLEPAEIAAGPAPEHKWSRVQQSPGDDAKGEG